MEINNKELLNRGLPKWPQMIVTGVKLTKEQTLEIIRRTDTFMIGHDGNDHDFIKKARKTLGMPEEKRYWDEEFKNLDGTHNDDAYNKYNREFWNKSQEWQGKWGVIETEYVHNSWISCAYIGGTHGWCHPDGTIGYSDNIGKWPNTEEIYNEWCLLAKEFPFIEIGVTLWSGESCEDNTRPVVSFKIKNGEVEIIDPEIEDVHEKHEIVEHQELNEFTLLKRLSGHSMENTIPLEILKQWHDKVFGISLEDEYINCKLPFKFARPYNLK